MILAKITTLPDGDEVEACEVRFYTDNGTETILNQFPHCAHLFADWLENNVRTPYCLYVRRPNSYVRVPVDFWKTYYAVEAFAKANKYTLRVIEELQEV